MNDLFSVGDEIEYGPGHLAQVAACNGNRVILSRYDGKQILFARVVFEGEDFYFEDEENPWMDHEQLWNKE